MLICYQLQTPLCLYATGCKSLCVNIIQAAYCCFVNMLQTASHCMIICCMKKVTVNMLICYMPQVTQAEGQCMLMCDRLYVTVC